MVICMTHKDEQIGKLLNQIEFESEEERIRYIVGAFPELVKCGKFDQAMQLAIGNGIPSLIFRVVNRASIWLTRSAERLVGHITKKNRSHEPILYEADI